MTAWNLSSVTSETLARSVVRRERRAVFLIPARIVDVRLTCVEVVRDGVDVVQFGFIPSANGDSSNSAGGA